jgi:mono/diheme cytochrome c family protein
MKNRFVGIGFAAAFVLLLTISCTKENVQDLSGGASAAVCDSTNSKYGVDVLPILQANCYNCHGNGNTAGSGGINLDGYPNLVKWVNNNGRDYLIGNITHAPGYVAMPYGLPKLDDCDINKIISWVNNGAQDN